MPLVRSEVLSPGGMGEAVGGRMNQLSVVAAMSGPAAERLVICAGTVVSVVARVPEGPAKSVVPSKAASRWLVLAVLAVPPDSASRVLSGAKTLMLVMAV